MKEYVLDILTGYGMDGEFANYLFYIAGCFCCTNKLYGKFNN